MNRTSPTTALRGVAALAALAPAPAATAPAQAHHSFAMFDRDKSVTVEGVVAEFDWTNPHSWIHMTASGPGQQPVVLSFEIGGGPTSLPRRGWKRSSFKPGDKISVVYHPLRNGGNGGQLVQATTADGKVLK